MNPTLAADSRWNKSTSINASLHGLSNRVKDQLIVLDIPEDLDEVIAPTNKIARHILDRDKERDRINFPSRAQSPRRPSRNFFSSVSKSDKPEPMQLGGTRLSAENNTLRSTITVSFILSGKPIQQTILVNYGVDACFMDSVLA